MVNNATRDNLSDGQNPGRVLDALRSCESFADIKALGILFHGTCERIEGPLRGGGYDEVFWAADRPSVAQSYIPRAGSSTWISEPESYNRNHSIQPHKHIGFVMSWALERAGVTLDDLDISWNGQQAAAWSVPDGWPTEGDLDDMIRGLGYKASDWGMYTILTSYAEGREVWMPADWNIPGQLIIALPDGDFDLRDPRWSEDALGYTSHNRVADFKSFAEADLHAFYMEDQLQSDFLGNVGHQSVGILPEGLKRLSWLAIPAIRHDGEDLDVFRNPETPEFIKFMRALSPDYKPEAEIASDLPAPDF